MDEITQVDLERWFDKFNLLYFKRRLSKWNVKNGFPPGEYNLGMPLGYCVLKEKTLYVAGLEMNKEEAQQTLIHEMVHANGIDWHGKRFRTELKRLKKEGAPVSDSDLKKIRILKGDEVRDLIINTKIDKNISIKEAQINVAYTLGFKSLTSFINRYPKSA